MEESHFSNQEKKENGIDIFQGLFDSLITV